MEHCVGQQGNHPFLSTTRCGLVPLLGLTEQPQEPDQRDQRSTLHDQSLVGIQQARQVALQINIGFCQSEFLLIQLPSEPGLSTASNHGSIFSRGWL
jgi:hypothetical protein